MCFCLKECAEGVQTGYELFRNYRSLWRYHSAVLAEINLPLGGGVELVNQWLLRTF